MTDHHEKDRAFLAWAKAEATLPADLRAKWYELCDIGFTRDAWKLRVIERELVARGEELPF